MVLLFDIDGTLIDHERAEAEAVALLQRRLGIVEDEAAFLLRWHERLEFHYDRYLAGELTQVEQRRCRFRDVVSGSLSDAECDRLSAEYLDDYLARCRPYDDVLPALRALSEHRLGVISNGDGTQQSIKLRNTGLLPFFQSLTFSADCGMAKPARGIFDLACRTMGARPAECFYVGDRPDIDAQAAGRAGLTGLWLDRAGGGTAPEGAARITTLAQLPAILAR